MKEKKKKNEVAEQKVRRFPKFYILDVVIIILVVAIFLGIYFRYSVFDLFGNSKNQVDAEVSFLIKNIKETTGMYVDIGDKIYFESDGSSFGVIMASTENSERALLEVPAQETIYRDGAFITVNYPSGTRIDAEGKIKCKGTFGADGSFMLNGTDHLTLGQKITVCTERVTVEITVASISKTAQ